MKSLVILISGRGSNLQALIEARLAARIARVISDNPAAGGLAIAARHGIPIEVIERPRFASREAFEAALAGAIDAERPDLVCLAGFMRVLGEAFVARYVGRLVNIHPSLLPAFPGLHTHRRALEAGVRLHGCTVHFVTPQVDGGPIVIQAAVPVAFDDSEATLAARVLKQEHLIYPRAVAWLLEAKLALDAQGRVRAADPALFPVEPGAALVSPGGRP